MSIKKSLQSLLLLIATFFTFTVYAQTGAITGTVLDESGAAVVGATVTLKGSNNSVKTNASGKFNINAKTQAEYLTVSAPGMASKTITVGSNELGEITLNQKSRALSDVVVVGYGSTKQKDVTGSVASIKSKDFNQGVNGTAEQLIIGKVAGVQITTAGGAPGSGSRIRIRGGSSLNASNDPLIVIDGVPIDNFKMGGSANPLNMINPNDIESFDILKDASATAIYGSRASNGVIIITTKKGTKKDDLHVSFSTLNSLQTRMNRKVNMLNTNEYRELFNLTQDQSIHNTLGNANTDWSELILRDALSSDNNVSITGGIKGFPYRLSMGYLNQQGMMLNNDLNRGTIGLNISPTFFNNTLKVNASIKNSTAVSNFTDEEAIGAALTFDPTQNVRSENATFGNYFAWVNGFGVPISTAPANPVSLASQRTDRGVTKRTLGNLQLDYKIPFVNGLRANLNLAFDNANTDGMKEIPYTNVSGEGYFRDGKKQAYGESRTNKLMEIYLNYNKEISKDKLNLDVTAGHSYQSIYRDYPVFADRSNLGAFQTINLIDYNKPQTGVYFASRNVLISLFGRANFTIYKHLLVTATVRNDNTSRFDEVQRSGIFPAFAAAYRINDAFLKNNKNISTLKLRIGWGQTGQQDIFDKDRPLDYLYLPKYNRGDEGSAYQIGNDYITVLRPTANDPKIKWETTTTANAGLDFGFFKNRLYGTIDVYNRVTTDLLANVPVSAGLAVGNKIFKNIGTLSNNGLEFSLGGIILATKNVTWDANFNYTYNVNKFISINKTGNDSLDTYYNSVFPGFPVGGITGGTGGTIQTNRPGYATNSFYAYQQVYGTDGKPLEGVYVDQNGDNVITNKDLVIQYQSEPRNLFGFSTNIAIKRFTFGAVARAQTGGYVYNNPASNLGNLNNMRSSFGFNSNVHGSYYDTRFRTAQSYSNYYLENGAFLRLDNVSVGYNFGNVLKKAKNGGNMRASFMVQNVGIITNYTGVDPEIVKEGNTGVDNNIYPRARTYSIGINLDL